jgi:hypothetical protein
MTIDELLDAINATKLTPDELTNILLTARAVGQREVALAEAEAIRVDAARAAMEYSWQVDAAKQRIDATNSALIEIGKGSGQSVHERS